MTLALPLNNQVEAINAFEGGVVLISHDRRLLQVRPGLGLMLDHGLP